MEKLEQKIKSSKSNGVKKTKKPLTFQEKILKKISNLSTTTLLLFLAIIFALVFAIFLFFNNSNSSDVVAINAPHNNIDVTQIGEKVSKSDNITISNLTQLVFSVNNDTHQNLQLMNQILPAGGNYVSTFYNINNNSNKVLQINTNGFSYNSSPNLVLIGSGGTKASPNFTYQAKQFLDPSLINNYTLECDKILQNGSIIVMNQNIISYKLEYKGDNDGIISIYRTPKSALIYSLNFKEKKNYQFECKNGADFINKIDNLYASSIK